MFSFTEDINEDKNNDIKIDLKKSRIKNTNKKIDFTAIEILPEDNIFNLLIDDDLSNDYEKNTQIFLTQFPKGHMEKLLEKKKLFFL